MLGDHKRALADAERAVELRRGLQGTEAELISSLYLLQQELKALGREEEANAAGTEADTLTERTNDPHFKLANRLVTLSKNFDAAEAEAILAEAKAAENFEVIAGVQMMQATLIPDLSDTQRIQKLEVCLNEQALHGLSEGSMAPARQALVHQLFKMGELDRAEIWLRKIVAANPIDRPAKNELVGVLWKQGKWGDVVILLRHEIVRFGEMPGLMLNLGNALREAGNLSEAVTTLTKAANLAVNDPKIKELALQYREEALQSGGTILQAKDETPPDAPITSEMFERALLEFCAFVKADKRMAFWMMGEKDYEWIAKPESHAQTLLHTYLKGKFGERINVFEEIKTGAGRLDIYVQLTGGLALVVELKMCGYGYSSTYAASGEEQVLHYMEHRHTNLGYLVVFDARLDRNGEKVMPDRLADRFTVKEIECDVRPRFSKKGLNA
jgi:tetratricopeptide (TPR) repeat protein